MINQTHERAQTATSLPRAMSLAVHELRTPVTVVAGYLRMLLKEQAGPLSEKQRKMIEEADRSCARIGALVAEMSEFGKLEGGELGLARVPFDLAALVAESADGMQDEDRGVRAEIRGADRQVSVNGDRVRIGAAIKALVHAAIRERATPGAVVVECSIVDSWGVVAIGDEALLPAVRSDAAARAADGPPGFDEWRGGMGLSLPVARRVVDAQGGAIWSAVDGAQRAAGLRLPLAQ